jgi:TonB family protein
LKILLSRSNESLINKPVSLSLGIHSVFLVLFAIFYWLDQEPAPKELKFTVVEKFKVVPKAAPVVEVKKPKPKKIKKAKRKVYGLNRKSVTSSKGVDVKRGNTLATTPDNKKLKKDDEDSIPIPTDEFLISSMPKVLEEIRPDYPLDAKKEGIQGSVIMEIIIDAKGIVRSTNIIRSLDPRLDQAALAAMKRFKFRPAMMDDSAVAVKIKYAIKFVLED